MDVTVPAAELAALLGRGTHFEGKLHFDGRVRIDGNFRGQIHSDDMLVIGDGADIEADVEVGSLIIRGGRVHGKLRARNCIELYVPAQVSGSLQAPEIFMDKGVQFSGSCTIAPLDDRNLGPLSLGPAPDTRP
jgi:cytoskeletal protein CcmA (bactofilin family)